MSVLQQFGRLFLFVPLQTLSKTRISKKSWHQVSSEKVLRIIAMCIFRNINSFFLLPTNKNRTNPKSRGTVCVSVSTVLTSMPSCEWHPWQGEVTEHSQGMSSACVCGNNYAYLQYLLLHTIGCVASEQRDLFRRRRDIVCCRTQELSALGKPSPPTSIPTEWLST